MPAFSFGFEPGKPCSGKALGRKIVYFAPVVSSPHRYAVYPLHAGFVFSKPQKGSPQASGCPLFCAGFARCAGCKCWQFTRISKCFLDIHLPAR
jgi:hypothetical protein